MKNVIADLAPAAPPSAITGLSVLGIPLPEVVLLLNAVYITLGIAYLIYKWYKGGNHGGE